MDNNHLLELLNVN